MIIILLEDIIADSSGNRTVLPSALAKVNSQDLDIFLEGLAQLGFLQGSDALYTNLMFEMAFDVQSIQTRYTGGSLHLQDSIDTCTLEPTQQSNSKMA